MILVRLKIFSHKRFITMFVIWMLISVSVYAQTGDGYDLSWNTIDGGGGPSRGGLYVIAGTIGQPDAGLMADVMAEGSYELYGGFWPGAPLCEDCFPDCHPDYDEWVSVGMPCCWCNLRQCHGDSDHAVEGGTKGGYYYVHYNDLNLLLACWPILEPNDGNPYPGGPGAAWYDHCICADFAHDAEGGTKTGYYRVHYSDLTILLNSWNILEPAPPPIPSGPGIEPNCLDCP